MKIRNQVFTLFFISLGIFGQEYQPISKTEFLNAMMENGNTLKIESQNVLEARGDYRQSNAIFLPKISASYTGLTTTNPLMAFGSKLNQEVLTATDFDPNLLNDPSRTDNYATKLEVRQPLVNVDGIHQRKAAKAKYQAAQYQKERTKDYLVLEADNTYMRLQIAYKTVEVLEKSRNAALENLRLARNGAAQGYLQKADLLALEVRLLEIENQLQYARSDIKNISGDLSVLMNEPRTKIFKPSDSLEVISKKITQDSLSQDRADLRAMSLASDAYEQQYKSSKMAFLPRLNAFGSYELYDDEIFQADANGYVLGVQLSWDILDGSTRFGESQKNRAAFERSKLEYSQYVSESRLEIEKALRMLTDAENNLRLNKLSLAQSKESLRIRTNRFKEGLERTSDLLMSEAQYSQKQLEYYRTVYQYNYALAYVRFLTK